MSLFSLAKQYADHIGGQFMDYDPGKAIMVVPLSNGRFQTIVMLLEKSNISGVQRVTMTSKICEYSASHNLKELLEASTRFDYSKFIIDEGCLKIEASGPADGTSEDELKCMIQEVATLADEWELKITGRDIH